MQNVPKIADLVLFSGQSNMAGRGITSPQWPNPAPIVPAGLGYEFRAVTDPTRLYPMTEPFGVNENRAGGIYEPNMKTGSMVSAFTLAYTANNGGIPVVGVSASKGGSVIAQWQPETPFFLDMMERYHAAEQFLQTHGCTIRHRLVLWCQGESDCDVATPLEDYRAAFQTLLTSLLGEGLEQLLLVTIGQHNAPAPAVSYQPMIDLQRQLAQELDGVTLVCDRFPTMRERGLMKDAFHYVQAGYNEAGREAGKNTAHLVIRKGF